MSRSERGALGQGASFGVWRVLQNLPVLQPLQRSEIVRPFKLLDYWGKLAITATRQDSESYHSDNKTESSHGRLLRRHSLDNHNMHTNWHCI